MTKSDSKNGAFGQPGIHPRWTHGGKDGVGTAYAASSQIWFTLWNGIIIEVCGSRLRLLLVFVGRATSGVLSKILRPRQPLSESTSSIFRSLRRSVRRSDLPSSGPKAIRGKAVTTWSTSNNRKWLPSSAICSSKEMASVER